MKSSTLLYFPKLNARQQRAIPALMAAPTTRAAADLAGIHEMTLIKWLKQPMFEAAYREARYIAMTEAFMLSQKTCTRAVQTIITMMDDAEANPFARLRAAQSVIDIALKSRTVDELEARIAALEQAEAEHAGRGGCVPGA